MGCEQLAKTHSKNLVRTFYLTPLSKEGSLFKYSTSESEKHEYAEEFSRKLFAVIFFEKSYTY